LAQDVVALLQSSGVAIIEATFLGEVSATGAIIPVKLQPQPAHAGRRGKRLSQPEMLKVLVVRFCLSLVLSLLRPIVCLDLLTCRLSARLQSDRCR